MHAFGFDRKSNIFKNIVPILLVKSLYNKTFIYLYIDFENIFTITACIDSLINYVELLKVYGVLDYPNLFAFMQYFVNKVPKVNLECDISYPG